MRNTFVVLSSLKLKTYPELKRTVYPFAGNYLGHSLGIFARYIPSRASAGRQTGDATRTYYSSVTTWITACFD